METSTETPKSARWQKSLPKTRTPAVSAGAAVLLHVAVGVVLLAMVRSPVAPKLPDEETVAFVFAPPQPAPPQPVSPEPASSEPAAMPDPPVAAAMPSPPEPQPPASAPETKSTEAPPPIPRPPVAHKTPPRAKPVPPPHIAETPPTSQPHLSTVPANVPADVPPSQPTSRSPAAAAPIPSDWQHSLATWLSAHKTYPEEARRRGSEGNVVLRFTVDRSGHVLDVVLAHSAGSSVLDAAAEAMVRNAMLPPFTAGMSQDTVTISVQIHYALTN